MLSLAKLLIDSLNEKELLKVSKPEKEQPKGLDKLEAFLRAKQVNSPEMMKFLKNLQELRSSGSAHLKGKKYESMKDEFGIGDKPLKEVFDDILVKAIWTLKTLRHKLLPEKTDLAEETN